MSEKTEYLRSQILSIFHEKKMNSLQLSIIVYRQMSNITFANMKIKSKKITKTFMMILGIVTILSAPISASGLLSEEEKNQVRAEMKVIVDNMDLNQDQRDQIKALREKNQSAVQSIKESDLSQSDKEKKMKKKMKEMRKNSDKMMKSILTKEQYKEFKKKRKSIARRIILG